ncbi:MAG TPA: hypothetical protein VFO16_08015 [Pseudonocardiaceae bacterium]|nr:hypothetical protein [Pseudonocardiaceae bacterium]
MVRRAWQTMAAAGPAGTYHSGDHESVQGQWQHRQQDTDESTDHRVRQWGSPAAKAAVDTG